MQLNPMDSYLVSAQLVSSVVDKLIIFMDVVANFNKPNSIMYLFRKRWKPINL